MTRRRAGVVAVVAASMLAISAAIPWAGSGEATRNAYSLARATRGAGLLEGASGVLASLVLLLPMLASIAVTLLVLGAKRIASFASIACGGVGILAAWAVLESSLETKPGAIFSAAIALLAIVFGSIAAAERPDA